MPYKIFSENGKQCVYKHDESGAKVGSSLGCHPSRAKAVMQLRALYANESKELIGEKARADLEADDFLVPKERSLPITKTPGGEPNRALCGAAWAALHEGFRGNKYEGPGKAEALKRLTAIYNRMDWPLPGSKECQTCTGPLPPVTDVCPSCGLPANIENVRGIKAIEQDGERYLVLWTSNAFKDREKEIFETKAWEDYVTRRDSRGGKYDRVWFWHMKGTDFADIMWEGVVGRVLVDVARVDHTEYGNKMFHAIMHPEEFPDVAPLGWGTSHGFAYRASDKEGGVYSFVEKFESTVLPYHRASNLWGGIKEVMTMAITKEKKDALASLVGQALAEQTLADAEKATSILEQAGISFKEDEPEEDEQVGEEEVAEDESEDVEESTDEEPEEDNQLYELEVTDDLVKEIASHVDVASGVKEIVDEQVKGLKESIIKEITPAIINAVKAAVEEQITGSKEAVVQQALAGKIRLSPWSASKSDDTLVPDGMVSDAKESKNGKRKNDVVASVVSRMLSGE